MIFCIFFGSKPFAQIIYPLPPYLDPSKGDQKASGTVSGTRNTGTDFWSFNGSEEKGVQVMVWDGSPSVFSWHYNPDENTTLKGNIELTDLPIPYLPNCDPDVVVAEFDQDPNSDNRPGIFALVVGLAMDKDIGKRTRVLVTSFVWSNGKFILNQNSCETGQFWLGNVWGPGGELRDFGFESTGRDCQSPNVDVNSAGQVAIAWTEVEQNLVKVKTFYPVPPFVGPTPVESVLPITKGNVYAEYGFVNGTQDGIKGGKCMGVTNCGPKEYTGNYREIQAMHHYPIALPGELTSDGINYLYSFPTVDVAISERVEEGGDPFSIASFTYMRSKTGNTNQADGSPWPNEVMSGLFVRQVGFGKCVPFVVNDDFNPPIWKFEILLKRNLSGAPRIAAPSYAINTDNIRDFTVVQGNAGLNCDDRGYFFNSSLMAWSRVGNVILNEGSLLLRPDPVSNNPTAANLDDASNITLRENTNPVVAYCNSKFMENNHLENQASFVVIWQSMDETNDRVTIKGRNILGAVYWADPGLVNQPNAVFQYPCPVGGLERYLYSVINFSDQGRQITPSVAGRYAAGLMAYDWDSYTEGHGGNMYKRSDLAPGIFSIGNNCPDCQFRAAVDPQPSEDISAEPNPGRDRFTIRVGLDEEEQILGYSIYDLQGKLVFESRQKVKQDFVDWKPEAGLKPGIFQVKLLTSKRSLSTRIVKQ
jgi:hypothetical protein